MAVDGRLGIRLRRGAALGVLACSVAFGVASPAQAAGELCDPGVVYDGADVFEDRVIARAANGAFDDQVTVKVISWKRVPGTGELIDALYDARAECGGWGFTPGGGRSLLVLGVSTEDGYMGTQYDGAALGRLDAARDDVELGDMGPNFGNGRWTDGMVAGLQGYAEAYDAPDPTQGPQSTRGPQSTQGPGQPETPSGNVHPEVLLWVFGVPVGAAAVGGAGYGASRLRRRLKARAAARASLGAAVSEMAQTWFALDESNELIDARVTALPAVSDSVADGIRTAHAHAVTVREGATQIYLSLAELHTETAIAKIDTDEALRAKPDVDAATAGLRGAQQAMDDVEGRLSTYDTLREQLPARIAALRAGALEVTAMLSARQREGYRTTDNDPAPDAAERAAVAVTELRTEQRFGDAGAAIERAEVDLAAHRTWLSELAELRATLVRDTAQLRTRGTQLDRAIADAYVTTDGLERDQDASCVEGIRATVDRASAARKTLEAALSTIERHTSMADQQFALAREKLSAARQVAETISIDAAAPALRVEELRALAVDLPLRADRAVLEADAIQGQVTTHPAAMTFLDEVPDVSTHRAGAASVAVRAREPRAPYLRLDEELGEAESGLGRARAVVDQGVAAHEASQRALENAAASVSAAEREVSHADVSGAARELLEVARSLLADAERETSSVAAITAAADASRDKANAASAQARQDRRDAEQRREAARRAAASAEASRRRSSSRSFSGGGSSRSSSSRSGGGGSRSFRSSGGSRRSGGGGSRKF